MAVRSEPLHYSDRSRALTGELFHAEASAQRRPGVLVLHGGAGLDDHAREQARRFAAMGLVALAADLYGPGIAGSRERVIATVTALREAPSELTQRVRAGLEALRAHGSVDGQPLVVGYCFGGMAALELARSGAEVSGVVSVHGTLSTVRPASPGSIRTPVLVCHGASDPHVPIAQLTAFIEEMGSAGADWQVQLLGGAVHGFTHRHQAPGVPGIAYDAAADARSWAAIRTFAQERFGQPFEGRFVESLAAGDRPR